jgi:hypothetical protein
MSMNRKQPDRYMDTQYLSCLKELVKALQARLIFATDDRLHLNEYEFINSLNKPRIEA